jgi:lipopolysaccharide export system permease protein
MTLIWPTIILATVLSFVTVWLNDVAVSWGYNGVRTVVINAVEDIIYGVLRTQRSYTGKTFSVHVKRVEGRRLMQPIMSFAGSGDMPNVTITAEEAEFRSTPGSGILTVICRNGDIEIDGSRIRFPDEIERELRLDDASGKGEGNLSPAHLSMVDIPQRIAGQRVKIERGKQLLAASAAYRLMTGELADLGGSAWASQSDHVDDEFTVLHRLRTEPPRRWANGFSCLCFALVGIPLAIRLRNADMLTSFFACFGPILVVYYPLMAFGLDRAKAGALPPMIVWLANAMMVLWGLWLLRRVVRY